jgi:hypothetical protein
MIAHHDPIVLIIMVDFRIGTDWEGLGISYFFFDHTTYRTNIGEHYWNCTPNSSNVLLQIKWNLAVVVLQDENAPHYWSFEKGLGRVEPFQNRRSEKLKQ